MALAVASHSLMGAGRAFNEDAVVHLSVPDPLGGRLEVFAVADGHGGHGAAAFFAKMLGGEMELALRESEDDIPGALAAAVLAVDAAWLSGPGEEDDSGACVLLCVRDGEQVHTAWAGDCRAVLYRGDRSMPELLSRDHTVCNAQERERLLLARVPVRHGRVMGVMEPTRAIGNRTLRIMRSDAVVPICETVSSLWLDEAALEGGERTTVAATAEEEAAAGLVGRPRSPQRKLPFRGSSGAPDSDPGHVTAQEEEMGTAGWGEHGQSRGRGERTSPSPLDSPSGYDPHRSPTSSSESDDSAVAARQRRRLRRRRAGLAGQTPSYQEQPVWAAGYPASRGGKPSFLILGTDGLWNGISSTRACEVMLDALAELDHDAGADVVQAAVERATAKLCRTGRSYGDDDCTCMVVLL
jgi:serine/threonine protein phosphatase PrpC